MVALAGGGKTYHLLRELRHSGMTEGTSALRAQRRLPDLQVENWISDK
jgi:hypothetical protein